MSQFISDNTKKSIKEVVFAYKKKREKTLQELGLEEENYKKEMAEIRGKVFDDFENNLKKAKENLQTNGFKVFEAKNAKDAQETIKDLLKDSRNIVKSKTNTGREISLEEALVGVEHSETDLGDFIVELFGGDEMHYVLPALHIEPDKIAEKIKEKYGDEIEADPEKLTHYLCGKIREDILKADTGITGANFFTADGQIVLLENEGNISLVSRLPQKHIIVCGIDKLVDSADDAVKLCRTAAIFGTGQKITQYISIISGPSKTADIQNQLVEGAQGTREAYVILIDNGRRKMMEEGFGQILRCINCGACLNFCPAYYQLGNAYGGEKYIGSKGIVLSAFQEGLEKAINNGSFNCTLCGNCFANCPMQINLPEMVRKIRTKQSVENLQTEPNKNMMEKIKKDGNPFGKVSDKEIPDKLYCC